LLALMLCAAGCASVTSRTQPSISPSKDGAANAYRMLMPAGSRVTFPDQRLAKQFGAVAYNEVTPTGEGTYVIEKPLQVVSPAWIEEQEDAEIRMHQKIEKLETEIRMLRAGGK